MGKTREKEKEKRTSTLHKGVWRKFSGLMITPRDREWLDKVDAREYK